MQVLSIDKSFAIQYNVALSISLKYSTKSIKLEGEVVDSPENMRILEALASGNYRVTLHAKRRMSERSISHEDVRCCAQNGFASSQPDNKIRVVGLDLDNMRLVIICVFEIDVLIISAF